MALRVQVFVCRAAEGRTVASRREQPTPCHFVSDDTARPCRKRRRYGNADFGGRRRTIAVEAERRDETNADDAGGSEYGKRREGLSAGRVREGCGLCHPCPPGVLGGIHRWSDDGSGRGEATPVPALRQHG